VRRTGPERDLGPAVERLISETRERTHARLARRERLLHAAFSAGFLLAAGLLAAAAPAARELDPLLAVLLVLAYALVARVEFAAGAGIVVPTQLVFVPMLLLLPTPLVPLLVAAAYVLSDLTAALRDRLDAGRAVIAPANAWFSVWPALALVLASAQLPEWSALPWFALALAAQLGGELAMTIARLRLTLGLPAREVLPELVLTTRIDALLAPVGLLAAFGAADEPYAVLLVLPLVVLFAIFAREREARIDHALELSQAYKGTALLLGDVIEADDQYTGDHTRDVVELTLQVADALGVDAETRRGAEFGALLHDVGKINIPPEIINKPGPLDDDEWAIMKTHTIEGQRMLERVGGLLADVGVVVRASHERWDGGGYPDGLAGKQIPLAARIVSVCDAYNAMTTDRSYRRALHVADATAELERCAGTQFDPRAVAALVRIVAATADRAPDWQLTLAPPPADEESSPPVVTPGRAVQWTP
jgi:HD-GYP domain-containing protein (c-di-GMP phosphodiesterase class II)